MDDFQKRIPRAHASRRGFTLLELLVVAVIVALLAGLSFQRFRAKHERSRATTNLASLRNIDRVINVYLLDGAPVPDPAAPNAWQTASAPFTSGMMTSAERQGLVRSLMAAGRLSVEGSVVDEANRIRAYRSVNSNGTSITAIAILQYRGSSSDTFVVNADQSLSTAFIADADASSVGGPADFAGLKNHLTTVSWNTAFGN